MESESQCLPDTQPVTNSQDVDILREKSNDRSWGCLHPSSLGGTKPYELEHDKYSIGRAASCDITLKLEYIGEILFPHISKMHFSIIRDYEPSGRSIIKIKDHSSNGTYVNGKKIGQNNERILSNNDCISIASKNNRLFTFINLDPTTDRIPEEVKRTYAVLDFLGKGGFGEVYSAYEKETAKRYAIKILTLDTRPGSRDAYNEIVILYKIKHENIVTFHDVIKTHNQLFVVLEYMNGGDLGVKLVNGKPLTETETKHIFYQVLLAVQHLHQNKIIHRDLKPANILLSSHGPYPVAKVTDFGLSKFTAHMTTRWHTACGTPCYTAPEMMFGQNNGTYCNKVDVWSLGVILFICLSREVPFSRKRTDMPFQMQIKLAAYNFQAPIWQKIGSPAKSLIRRMIVSAPSSRMNIREVLSHPWIFQDLNMKQRVRSLSGGSTEEDKSVSEPDAKRLCTPTRRLIRHHENHD